MRRLRLVLLALPLALPCRPAAAQAPAAPEVVVNASTNGTQRRPSLGMDAGGNFVVAWQSVHDGTGYSVFAQRFDAAGARSGAEFRVNTTTPGNQYDTDVAVDARGDFVVVWSHASSILAQRFTATCAAAGGEFQVNTYTTGVQREAVVAADPAGNFVVAWMSLGQDGSDYGVFARRFDAAGGVLGSEFRVNTYVTGAQRRPDVAFTADGGFVIVWSSPDASSFGVFGQRYDTAGTPVGPEFPLATAAFSQSTPAVAALPPPGGFVVAWTSYAQDGSHNAVRARRFAASGSPSGDEFAVNTYTGNSQSIPVVATDGLGNFVVIWQSFLQEGSDEGVYGQRFDAAGARRGAEFQLNAFTTLAQMEATAGSDSAGNFVAAWTSTGGQDGSDAVIGRRCAGGRHAGQRSAGGERDRQRGAVLAQRDHRHADVPGRDLELHGPPTRRVQHRRRARQLRSDPRWDWTSPIA